MAGRKVRFYPKNKELYKEAINIHRRAYNLAVAIILNNENDNSVLNKKDRIYPDKSNVRSIIREIVRKESTQNNTLFISVISDEAVRKAFIAQSAVIKDRIEQAKNGTTTGDISLSFKSRKAKRQYFVVQKLTNKGEIYPQKLGKVHFSESVNSDGFMNMATITLDHDRWFINSKMIINTNKTEIQGKICAIDPGIRTFATVFSGNNVTKYGSGFATARISPLAKALYKLISARDKLLNLNSKSKWVEQKLIHFNRRINQINCKQADLVNDLHKRVAYDIIMNNDIIFLPTFEVKQMTKKDRRNIFKSVVRSMLGLGHYKFKLYIKWLARKYGKTVIDVNESYTSKTRSWDGYINDKLGPAKFITDGAIKVDRDINGARGIFLRALSKGNYTYQHHQQWNVEKSNKNVSNISQVSDFGVIL